MDEIDIINTILSKLDFSPIYHKIIKKDNKIFIKCHSYFINIFNNDNDNIILKTIEYKQPSIFVNNNYINIIDNDNDNENDNDNDNENENKKRIIYLYYLCRYYY